MKFALLLITISFLSTHSFAQDATGSTTTPPPATPTVPTSLDVTKGNPAIIKIIEDKFNLSADDIAKYRSEKLGYGQIMLMAEFAKSSEKSMDEVVASELKISSEDMAKIRKEIRPLLREQNKDKKEETKEKKEKKNRKETDRDDDRKDDKKEERRNEQREERKAERKEERREDKRDERRDDRQDDRKTDGHKK